MTCLWDLPLLTIKPYGTTPYRNGLRTHIDQLGAAEHWTEQDRSRLAVREAQKFANGGANAVADAPEEHAGVALPFSFFAGQDRVDLFTALGPVPGPDEATWKHGYFSGILTLYFTEMRTKRPAQLVHLALCEWAEKSGYSKEEIATHSGVSLASVYRLVDKRKRPKNLGKAMKQICEFANIGVDAIEHGGDVPEVVRAAFLRCWDGTEHHARRIAGAVSALAPMLAAGGPKRDGA